MQHTQRTPSLDSTLPNSGLALRGVRELHNRFEAETESGPRFEERKLLSRLVHASVFDAARRSAAKVAFTARRVDLSSAKRLLHGHLEPRHGDLVLARVAELGHHGKLQLPNGRRSELFVGDEIVVAYGHRYAPNQWEADVPDDLGPCDLAAGGGIAARVTVSHSRMSPPTRLEPIGLLADGTGTRLNLSRFALPAGADGIGKVPVVAVVGTSMDSGKTTSAAALIRGLTRAGLRVGAAKVTGTGASGDLMLFRDSGTVAELDFVDAGFATTFRVDVEAVQRIVASLRDELVRRGAEVIVVEVADGIYQAETAALLRSESFRGQVRSVLFAAGEALAAVHGAEELARAGFAIGGLTGRMTASPLATAEARAACDRRVLPIEDLEQPEVAVEVLSGGSLKWSA